MARKQSDYLKELLSSEPDGPATPPAAERVRPTTLLSRESALARVQSGQTRQVTQHLLDPARVRVWPGNARIYAQLNEQNCRELIDSIIAEGGQKVPAVVRRVTDDPAYDYEVVAGTRRHWSVQWLRNHSYPDLRFLAQVANLDDEAAFRLADLENRARQDVSDIERARNYASALTLHYDGKQKRMAERLRVSPGWLSKMLQVANIPDNILAAFSSWHDVQLKPAYNLARALGNTDAAERIAVAATRLAQEQTEARKQGHEGPSASEVMRRLLHAAQNDAASMDEAPIEIRSALGRVAMSVQSVNRQGITVRLHTGAGADTDEYLSGLKDILERLRASGKIF